MDCFTPLMEKFNQIYGSFNNYLYCEEHGMKKYMKFTMYEKESMDKNILTIRTEQLIF